MSAPSGARPQWHPPVTYRFGVAMAAGAGPHSEGLAKAIAAAGRAAACAVTFADCTDTVAAELTEVRALRAQGVDGLLLLPSPGSDTVVTGLVRLGIPTVLLDRLAARDDVDQVGTEHVQSTAALTEHLASLGHRRIGLVTGSRGLPGTEERTLGYRLGLERAGLVWDARLVVFAGEDTTASVTAARALLDERPWPSAVVVTDPATLSRVRTEAQLAALFPPVTEVARRAVGLLLARIADPARPAEIVRVPPRLEYGGVCHYARSRVPESTGNSSSAGSAGHSGRSRSSVPVKRPSSWTESSR